MRVGILEVGRPPEEIASGFASYPGMTVEWLGCDRETTACLPLLDGALPPDPDERDLWIITGSRHSVYEDHAFIPPLRDFIRTCFERKRKLVGICFGHQIIADAVGGEVVRFARGWALGPHSYDVDPARAPGGFPAGTLRMHAFHQDQVVRAPESAVRIASSEFCENAAFWYPGQAITFQAHPEFRDDYMTAVLNMRRGRPLPEDRVDDALGKVGQPIDSPALAAFVRQTGSW